MRDLLLTAPAALLFLASCGSAPSEASTSSAASNAGPQEPAVTADGAIPTEPAMTSTDLSADSIYSLDMNSLGGEAADLGSYAGKVTLFVNVASRCGYTPQYADLQKLHDELGGEDFAIIGVPSNDFGGQEPGTPEEIKAFCSENYGVTFAMLEKVGTKDGDSEFFDRLAKLTGERPGWNFCKYVVSKDGTAARFFKSGAKPLGTEIRGAIADMQAM